MDEEIIEEVGIDTNNENINNTDMDNSIEEIESDNAYSQDELVSALLQLLEDNRENAEEDDDEVLENEIDSEIVVPVLVQDANPIDYSDVLTEMNVRLYNIESTLSVEEEHNSLATPFAEYDLNSVLLVVVILVLFITLGYQFLKDNFLHFRN